METPSQSRCCIFNHRRTKSGEKTRAFSEMFMVFCENWMEEGELEEGTMAANLLHLRSFGELPLLLPVFSHQV
jgi:hypothetical protein